MMKKLKIAALLSLGLVFSACAPVVLGSQVYTPLVSASLISPVIARAGQTVYVQYSYPRGLLDVADSRFDSFNLSFDSRTVSGDVSSQEIPAPWLTMTQKGLPAGWQISLADAAIRKEVLKTTMSNNSIDIRYVERLRVVYRVTVPAGASGSEFATLSFKDGSQEVGTIPLSIKAGDFVGPSVGAQF